MRTRTIDRPGTRLRRLRRAGMRVLLPGLLLALHAGCPGDSGALMAEDRPDLGAPPPDRACVPSPRTHVEILNACTDAQSVDKRVVLPLLRPDGTLPPLP
ncbi:MAG: hypothetical protein U1A78_21105 [Polyangia bacterium]